MAFCPSCKGVMGAGDTECPHCGYDFPSAPRTAEQPPTLAYSSLGDIALIAATIAASLSCLLTLFRAGVAFMDGRLVEALIMEPVIFLVQLGLLVVFLRVQEMDRP